MVVWETMMNLIVKCMLWWSSNIAACKLAMRKYFFRHFYIFCKQRTNSGQLNKKKRSKTKTEQFKVIKNKITLEKIDNFIS